MIAAVLLIALTGCGASNQGDTSESSGAIGPSDSIAAIPGTMPTRLCSDNIYSGPSASSVVRTPDDVVIGPLRFGILAQATGKGLYTYPTPDGLAYGIKSPLSVSGTTSQWVALRVTGDANQVKTEYRSPAAAPSSPDDPKQGSTVFALQTAVACGTGSTGFVQYNGGFVWLHPTCATLQVFDQSGHLLASMVVPFGKKTCH